MGNTLLLVQWHLLKKHIFILCSHYTTMIAFLSFFFINLFLQWMYLAALSTILTIVKCVMLHGGCFPTPPSPTSRNGGVSSPEEVSSQDKSTPLDLCWPPTAPLIK